MADVADPAILWDRLDWESSERTDPVLTSADMLQFGREQLPPNTSREDFLPRVFMGYVQWSLFKECT